MTVLIKRGNVGAYLNNTQERGEAGGIKEREEWSGFAGREEVENMGNRNTGAGSNVK